MEVVSEVSSLKDFVSSVTTFHKQIQHLQLVWPSPVQSVRGSDLKAWWTIALVFADQIAARRAVATRRRAALVDLNLAVAAVVASLTFALM